ncbi:MAG: prolipoprotein diacylglyceryl transferase [Anaerolineae bacterium]|nr:prolipoprotein diacylglyceryl transferase [Anaerolineae bacterium]MDH7472749.1 prolipoprotein diacylglyceryl transferase [Anaerolineae bacterium]
MHPILLRGEGFTLYTYTVLLDLGLICGMVLTWMEGRRLWINPHQILNAIFCVLCTGILGARLGYVLANWTYFSEHLLDAARLWKGGLSWYGGFGGGLIGLIAYVAWPGRKTRLSFWLLADALTPGLLLGMVWGWLACWMAGCAYGAPATSQSWVVWDLPDIYGVRDLRFATQPLGVVGSLVTCMFVWATRRRWPVAGCNFLTSLALIGGLGCVLELTRGDDTLYWGGWRAGQWLSLVMMVTGIVLLTWRWARHRLR